MLQNKNNGYFVKSKNSENAAGRYSSGSDVVMDYLSAGDILQFFPHAEGYVSVTQGNKGDANGNLSYIFNYVYNYTDHLGNIRLSYTKDPVSNELKILEENHYYPFGLKHGAYADSKQKYKLADDLEDMARPGYVTKTDYNYKFGAKEWQDELGLNLYDFGARIYDPAAPRFWQIDPMAEKSPDWTPYRYAFNNPMFFIDPTGMWEDDYQLHDDGSVTLLQKTDDKSDTLYASNADGSVDKSRSVTVQKENASDGSLIGDLSKNVGFLGAFKDEKGIKPDKSLAFTDNAQDAFNVFTFAAKNSSVEWGMAGFKDSNGWSFAVATSQKPSSVDFGFVNYKSDSFEFMIHSHKNRNSPSPSIPGQPGDYRVDASMRYHYKSDHKSFMLYAPNSGSMNLWKYQGTYNKDSKVQGTRANLGTVTQGSLSLKKLGF